MSERLTHGSLFSGIGGPEIAAEMMGWKNVFHCEINPFGRKILDYWFPNSKSYEDITKTDFREWRGKINVLTGGFPCQPFSCAGQRKGAEDDRYLWPEMLRAIREIQPDWVVGENVAGILTMVQPGSETPLGSEETLFGEDNRKRTLHRQEYVVETVCNDLEREGYSVQPVVIPACAVGAPHRRDRVFFIAHRADAGSEGMQREWENNILSGRTAPDTDGERCNNRSDNWKERPICYDQKRYSEENQSEWTERKRRTCENGSAASDSDVYQHMPCKTGEGFEKCRCKNDGESKKRKQSSEWPNGFHGFPRNAPDTDCIGLEGRLDKEKPLSPENESAWGNTCGLRYWEDFPTQSPVCSRDDGISTRLDGIAFSKWRQESIKAYGNAIVPQVMYEIFQAIESIEKGK